MREMNVEPRACICCGNENPIPVWNSESVVTRAKEDWRVPFFVSICGECGFSFASPAPVSKDLTEYHLQGLTGYKKIQLPTQSTSGFPLSRNTAEKDGVFIEIGGDLPEEFHSACSKLFKSVASVEIAEDTSADFRSIHDLEEESVDVIAHYDVLEHGGCKAIP